MEKENLNTDNLNFNPPTNLYLLKKTKQNKKTPYIINIKSIFQRFISLLQYPPKGIA
jgi:hypothetical protein